MLSYQSQASTLFQYHLHKSFLWYFLGSFSLSVLCQSWVSFFSLCVCVLFALFTSLPVNPLGGKCILFLLCLMLFTALHFVCISIVCANIVGDVSTCTVQYMPAYGSQCNLMELTMFLLTFFYWHFIWPMHKYFFWGLGMLPWMGTLCTITCSSTCS